MDEHKLRAAIRRLREEKAQLAASLNEAVGIIDEYEKQAPEIESMRDQLEALHGTIREGTHRAAFDELAEEMRLDPEFSDIVFDALKLDTSGDEPDAKSIKKALETFVKGKEKKLLIPEETDAETDDEDEGDAQGNDEPEASDESNILASIFNIAPKAKTPAASKGNTPATAKGNAQAESKPATKPTAPEKLSRGEGSSRGSRDDHRVKTIEEQIDADFAATGRTDAFRI